MYAERKKLLKGFPDSDIAIFIKENAIDPSEEIYRLTDNTQIERRQILSWVAHHEWNEAYAYVYPLLSSYLQKFIFDCGSLSDEVINIPESKQEITLLRLSLNVNPLFYTG